MRLGHIESEHWDQVMVKGTVWTVVDDSWGPPRPVYRVQLFGPLRCKLWGLFHGYGWLRVKTT